MIVYKRWNKLVRDKVVFQTVIRNYEGWFLLGFIPLYIRQLPDRSA